MAPLGGAAGWRRRRAHTEITWERSARWGLWSTWLGGDTALWGSLSHCDAESRRRARAALFPETGKPGVLAPCALGLLREAGRASARQTARPHDTVCRTPDPLRHLPDHTSLHDDAIRRRPLPLLKTQANDQPLSQRPGPRVLEWSWVRIVQTRGVTAELSARLRRRR